MGVSTSLRSQGWPEAVGLCKNRTNKWTTSQQNIFIPLLPVCPLHSTQQHSTPARGSNRSGEAIRSPFVHPSPPRYLHLLFSPDKRILRCYNSTRLVSVDRFLVGSNSPIAFIYFIYTSPSGALSRFICFGFVQFVLFGGLSLCRRPWPSGGVDSLLLGNSAEIEEDSGNLRFVLWKKYFWRWILSGWRKNR